MSDDKLTMIFDACIKGEGPDGWGGFSYPDIDTLTNRNGGVWVRQCDPDGPWTEIPGMDKDI